MAAQKAKITRPILLLVVAAWPLLFVACGNSGNSGSSSSTNSTSPNGNLIVTMQDASTNDWATIGVKVLSISLTPQGGGAPVTVFTAGSPAPMVHLAQLAQMSEV